jgi:hypothetical protein
MTRARHVLAAAVLGGVLMGCGTVHPTLDDLRAVPGGASQYPGSVEIESGNQESNANLVAKNAAVLRSYRCAGAPRETWGSWFADQLTAAGWELVHNPSFPGTDGSVLVGEWRRGDYLFDLYALSPAHLASLERQYGGPAGCTSGYETLMR